MTRTVLPSSVFLCVLALFALSACTLETRPTPTEGTVTSPSDRGGSNAPAGRGGAGGQSGSAANSGTAGMSTGGTGDPQGIRVDGESCGGDSECLSNHCIKKLCCSSGDCCLAAADCPMTIVNGTQLACNNPSECQGSGGSVVCRDFRCVVLDGEPNDSACTAQHQSKDCFPYKPVFCTGAADQQEPKCPSSCDADDDCANDAHCEAGRCTRDAAEGGDCKADKDCASNHCSNGVCCKGGDCCITTDVCQQYASPPACNDVKNCKGSFKQAICSGFQCQSVEVEDNTACAGMRTAQCGLYADAICSDREAAPSCRTQCTSNDQCRPGAFCSGSASNPGECRERLRDGQRCSANEQCEVACNNGVCCRGGADSTCCATNQDCSMLESNTCDRPNACAGTATRAVCNSTFVCMKTSTPDTNACRQTIDCGEAYNPPSLQCSATLQACGCLLQSDCASGFVCLRPTAARGNCIVDPNAGAAGRPAAGSGGGGAGGTRGPRGVDDAAGAPSEL